MTYPSSTPWIKLRMDVDRAWMKYQQAPIGPFGLMDLFGLNIIYDSWQQPKPNRAHLEHKVIDFIRPYIESNTLGIKTGRGFYSYPQPNYQDENFLHRKAELAGINEALSCVLISNAILIAHNDVAQPSAIDRAWVVSFKLGKGPFGLLNEMGIDTFLEAYSRLTGQGLFPAEMSEKVKAYLQSSKEAEAIG